MKARSAVLNLGAATVWFMTAAAAVACAQSERADERPPVSEGLTSTGRDDPPADSQRNQPNRPAEPALRADAQRPSFETKASTHNPPEPPLGSALFGGRSITFKELFETHDEPDPPGGKPWPDIKEPGPDFGDFPNSSFTLPKGRSYIEVAPLSLAGPDSQTPSSYAAPFLLRYGVTDDLEFRIFATGITHVFGSNPTTGFSPLALDLKIHLWDDKREWLLPASSLEVYVQTTWGSPQFSSGWEPSLNLNFDLPLAEKTNLEWTIGYSGVQDAVNVVTGQRFVPRHHFLVPIVHRANLNRNQFSIQWALEQDLTDKLQVFLHGFYNGGILIQQGTGTMVGGGLFWQFSKRLVGFGSVNAGLTRTLPPLFVQLGFAIAL